MSEVEWSDREKNIAKEALNKAYLREINNLIKEVRELANSISELNHLWQLHDFLSTRRHEIDGKYDYRDSVVLIFVFARLVNEGLLDINELEELGKDKRTKIAALARMQSFT